jgi:membrane protein DedA with SNARE-associated domain
VGLVCGLGESVGALTIYASGYSAGTPLPIRRQNYGTAHPKSYLKLMQMMEKRGSCSFLYSLL